MIRCVNLDWFELHALEPQNDPHDADYFRRAGLIVSEREYGTRVYKQMFTVHDTNGAPFIEVRRDPFSVGSIGIHTSNECHLRLVNAACYLDDAVQRVQQFLDTYCYTILRLTRVDICLDFERFDEGDDPAKFLRRYLQNRFAKINQGNITAHGTDRWDGQVWNSVSWGSPTSAIGTKFYNKTLEMYDPTTNTYKKPHIRWAWYLCGLIDDFHTCTKKTEDGQYTPQIWRVEFSIRSAVKRWFRIELNGHERKYQSIHNTLDMYDSRDKLLTMFAALSQHYFHFKHYETGKTKYECQDKVLFNWKGMQTTYKVGRDDMQHLLGDGRKQVRPMDSLLRKLREYRDTHLRKDIQDACQVLIQAIQGETIKSDLRNPFSYEEIQMLQRAISMKAAGNKTDVVVLMNEVKELLALNDKTATF